MRDLVIKNDQITRDELFRFYLEREDIHDLISFDDYIRLIEKQNVKVLNDGEMQDSDRRR